MQKNQDLEQLKISFIDPAINIYTQKLKEELKQTQEKLKQALETKEVEEFNKDSIYAKRLIAKCRALQEENEDLGNSLSEGRIQKLEVELALQKQYSSELKKSLDESNSFVLQLDEESEYLQQTILQLQQQVTDLQRKLKSSTESEKEIDESLNL